MAKKKSKTFTQQNIKDMDDFIRKHVSLVDIIQVGKGYYQKH